jgi:hypothetical protein
MKIEQLSDEQREALFSPLSDQALDRAPADRQQASGPGPGRQAGRLLGH